MIIETERVRLRKFRESDADDVHLYGSDPEVTQYTDWGPNTWQDTVEFVEKASSHPEGSLADLAITVRGDLAVVGGLGAFPPRGEDPDERPHVREIGWVLRKDLWGRGLVAEAMDAVIREVLEDPSITRLEARCRPQNTRSERIMQKLGMSLEFRLEGEYQVKGEWVDNLLYSLDLSTLR